MKIQVQLKFWNTTYMMEFDEKDEMDTLHKAIVLGNPPQYCNCCHNTVNFKLDSNKDKEGNTYINVVCYGKDGRNCFAKAKLGQYKAKGYFWHKFEIYRKPQEQED